MVCRYIQIFLIYEALQLCMIFSAQAQPEVRFTDVTHQSGLDFQYTFGDLTYGNILESSGSGVTVFDYDNDNFFDVYLLNGTYLYGVSDPAGLQFAKASNQLFHNNGDGTFTNVTSTSGLQNHQWSMAAAPYDYDGDEDVDLFLLNYGPNVFLRNNGEGGFVDVTDELKLKGPENLNGFRKWSVGAVFWDYNQDSRLDLMVGNFLAFDPAYLSPGNPGAMPHPDEYKGQASVLYQQQPDGTFEDVTIEMDMHYPDSKCMGLTVFDYDNDGDQDLFQSNDHQPNFLFQNQGQGRFKEVGIAAGVAVNSHGQPTGSMHGTIGDVDGDGYLDLLVTDLKYGALYRNTGQGLFQDITHTSGLAEEFNGKGEWAAALFDFDNDGDLDIFSANGTAEELVLQVPLLLENDGKGNFRNVGPQISDYFNTKHSGRGAAVWDYDNDGDLDIVVSHIEPGSSAILLKNDGGNNNHWVGLTLMGSSPPSAIGARVTLEIGNIELVRVNQWGTSYLSYHDPRMLIGIGQTEEVDKLTVRWSDGEVEEFENIPINRYITIRQGQSFRP